MIFKIDLLDALSIQADCTYLSDLRHLNDWQRMRLIRALEQTPSDAAELREWNDALESLTGARPRTDVEKARAALIAGLSAPWRARRRRGVMNFANIFIRLLPGAWSERPTPAVASLKKRPAVATDRNLRQQAAGLVAV